MVTNVLGSSLIWKCRNWNIGYMHFDFLKSAPPEENRDRYLKFKIQHVQIDKLPRTLVKFKLNGRFCKTFLSS